MRSMPIILGFLAGVGLPIQTSVNTRLRKKVGSPFNAALVSFLVGLLFLSALLLVTGQGLHIPFAQLLPVLGQILMGLTIDNFGLFYSQQTSLTAFRIAGAVLVLLGVVLVSTAKKKQGGPHQSAKSSTGLFMALESVFRL